MGRCCNLFKMPFRGFMTSGGRPDQARAARLLLKDYVGGR